jgi:hypothetical protein
MDLSQQICIDLLVNGYVNSYFTFFEMMKTLPKDVERYHRLLVQLEQSDCEGIKLLFLSRKCY